MLPDTALLAMVNANCLLHYNVNETEHCIIYNSKLHIYSSPWLNWHHITHTPPPTALMTIVSEHNTTFQRTLTGQTSEYGSNI